LEALPLVRLPDPCHANRKSNKLTEAKATERGVATRDCFSAKIESCSMVWTAVSFSSLIWVGGFSFPHESSETTLLQFVAVIASQQPPHIAVQEPHDGSRGQGVQLAEKDKALAHRVAATSLWSVSQSVLQNPCLRPDGVRSLDLQDFAVLMLVSWRMLL
jgi:hypothetical protein